MSEKPKLVLGCMADGPHLWQVSDEDEIFQKISCTRQKGHSQEHQWFSDDGSVRVTWFDEWWLGEGAWRQELSDE